ncbi:Dip2/Utp12 family-domain-containing protein [Biscogniauxia mediterranea]|nr:Dip2/Utp12 family-domain-containing protein [Biscogniauxia mediterranea]
MSTKRKPLSKIAHPVVKQSAKRPLKTTINESETAVSIPEVSKSNDDGANEEIIEISSDPGSSEYELSDEEIDDSKAAKQSNKAAGESKGHQIQTPSKDVQQKVINDADPDVDMPEANQQNDAESDQELAQPTLGELARAHDTIDVPSALSAQPNALAVAGKSLAPPSLSSLGTVLSQALRTDDTDLLESCLHTTDVTTVRNTIQRLDSTLAGTLLTKLAARMHRRPGRAGSLMAWVQWTLVAHGGALATQPALVKKLSELHRVLEERSRGLNSLLALKGKLDLLEAQMELRRGLQRNSGADEDDDEEGIIYVEGEDSDAEMANGLMDVDDDDDDELPITNGITEDDSDDDEISNEGSDNEEEAEGEELDEDDINHEDVESEEEDSEAEAVPQAPPAKKTRTSRRR